MGAHVGDHLVIKGYRQGQPERDGEILEVQGVNGTPPYRVRWSYTGREGIVFPGPDALVESPDDFMARHQDRQIV
jgi:hypothetical protein